MKQIAYFLLSFIALSYFVVGAEATDHREWTSITGSKLEASALSLENDVVVLRKKSGNKLSVPLSKLSSEDQEFLKEHFGENSAKEEKQQTEKATTTTAATDLPHPLGKTTGPLPCGKYHYFVYLPKTLRHGVKHPVLFIMSPGGGNPKVSQRYIEGAERNQWILAVSKESKNRFEQSSDAIMAMMKEVKEKYPIDTKRMYVSGFSGGARMSFITSQEDKSIAGIIACGAGGDVGSRKQVVYGICGSNCFNRTDMAHAFKNISKKDSVLRYFEGKHVWANAEMCDDGMTHLNGVFLIKNKSQYKQEYDIYVEQVEGLIESSMASNPTRAYMWADFLKTYGVSSNHANTAHRSLAQDEKNVQFVEGLYDIRTFAQKTFGKISSSQWKSDPKVAAACIREAKKYAGSYWEIILISLSKDAQKF